MTKNANINMKFGNNMYFDIYFWVFAKNTKFAQFYPDFGNFPDFADLLIFADFKRILKKIGTV